MFNNQDATTALHRPLRPPSPLDTWQSLSVSVF